MSSTSTFTIGPENELRVETSSNSLETSPSNSLSTSLVSVYVISGTCEVYGSELPLQTSVPLPANSSFPLFSYYGATILLHPTNDPPPSDSSATEPPPPPTQFTVTQAVIAAAPDGSDDLDVSNIEISYLCTSDADSTFRPILNTHAQLEVLRDAARKQPDTAKPPKVLIIGDDNVGKLTVLKTLSSYAIKVGRRPIVVNLDPRRALESVTPVPGTIGAAPIAAPDASSAFMHPTLLDSFTTSNTSTSYSLNYFFSAPTPANNPAFFTLLTNKLGLRLGERHAQLSSPAVLAEFSSGVLCLGAPSNKVEVHEHTVAALSINVVLVMGSDRLYAQMNKKYKATGVTVVKLPVSGGVVKKDDADRSGLQAKLVRSYFRPLPASPPLTTVTLNISTCNFYRLSSVAVSTAMLPVGQKQVSSCVHLTKIDAPPENSIVAVCHPSNVNKFVGGDESALFAGGVAGFLAVERVDEEAETVVVVSPVRGELPSKTFLCCEESAFSKVMVRDVVQ